MISVSATYDNIISNGGHYEWQIVNGANTFTIENLIDGKLSQILLNQVSVGNIISAQLDVQMYNATVDPNNSLILQFRAVSDSTSSEWNTKSTLFVDTLETSPYSTVTKLTAFDSLLKGSVAYQTSGEWTPVTDLIALNRIANDLGVQVDADTLALFTNSPKMLTASPNIGTDGTTDNEVLSYIGAMRGGNWMLTHDNKLKLVILSESPTETANVGNAVVKFDASPVETITKVRVWITDDAFYAYPPVPLQTHTLEDITDHNLEAILIRAHQAIEDWESISGRCLDVTIPFWADYAVGQALYEQFNGKPYYPYTAQTVYIDPKYELGDGVVIKDVTSIIANQTVNISALASCDMELKKEDRIDSLYPFKTKVSRQLSRNTTQIAANTAQIAENTEAISAIPEAIERATTLITGGYGGYVKWTYLTDGTPSELLFMDSPDESTATNILRINRNGIGFSTDGGATYANAWTIDGVLNADFINTGTLSADRIAANSIAVGKLTGSITNGDWIINLTNGTMTIGTLSADKIKAGTIADDLTTPKNYWNLTTGQFVTTQGEIGGFTISDGGLFSTGTTGEVSITPSVISTNTLGLSPNRKSSLIGGTVLLSVQDSSRNWLTGLMLSASADADGGNRNGFIFGPTNTTYISFSLNDNINIGLIGGTTVNISSAGLRLNGHDVLEVH